ncbi:hypothetical protein K458DRAFT_422688 [Lentithecium fluviatile CBS 122367]|uniref:Cellulosomal protein n=1 Tax=Lentithecium fluviatile CBS 122367 TaxID=1168545 RepID=A0A6G1ILQ7_9PLEO|nr:hypothetical protein K458DRAFT_422688 [Lentithecium fluviatile CBS 122367]
MGKQELMNSFYDIDNLLTIDITIPAADWQALKNAEPRGGRCNFGYIGDRFDWYKATLVKISGTKFPAAGSQGFPDVGIIKKSYCGSFSTTKPSLRLDFSRNVAANEKAVEDLIGAKTLTLNNSVQDSSYIRQTLGYELFRQAGLPYARCNYVKVVVNGTSMGIYINLEPIKKRYVEHIFGNAKGNAYELEVGEDLDPAIVNAGKISFEGYSDFEDSKDLKVAASQIATGGLAAAQQVVDMDEFIRFFAMESLLKHWDGYTQNRNNTYLYNDTVAVANPTAANVKFKFIPCGIDQIMQEGRDFNIGSSCVLANLVRNDTGVKAKLFAAIRNYANTIFSRDNHEKSLRPFIDKTEALLKGAGVDSSQKINTVRQQVKLIRSGAFQLLGEIPTDAPLLMNQFVGDCIHASNSEFVGGTGPNAHQEVYHNAVLGTGAPADRWNIFPGGAVASYKFKNMAYNTWLHCGSADVKTPGGNSNIYAFRTDPDSGNDFVVESVGVKQWHASGFFKLKSARTSQYVFFSETDLTPKGRKEVHQVGDAAKASVLFLF